MQATNVKKKFMREKSLNFNLCEYAENISEMKITI